MAKRKVRFGVVGLGYFAQRAILPAFKHARKTAELTALVSSDAKKLRKLGKRYDVEHAVDYDGLDALCRDNAIDAVYIATPNHEHRRFAERVAPYGIHVLCEKPLAVTEEDCQAMIRVCRANGARLMTAYRLHFEPCTLRAAELVRKGRIGNPRSFSSSFGFQVRAPNIRLGARDQGGGPLYDIGIYCLNAARMLFGDEPIEVFAQAARSDDERFKDTDEQVAAQLRFPGERLAQFVVGFGAEATDWYEVVGDEGKLRVEPAFDYKEGLAYELTVGDKKPKRKRFKRVDQIAAEIEYFSECVRDGKDPEPSGEEGLADVRVIRALHRSIDERRPIRLEPFNKPERPTVEQEKKKPPQRAEPPKVDVRPES